MVHISRRTVLTSALAAGAGVALGPRLATAHAAQGAPTLVPAGHDPVDLHWLEGGSPAALQPCLLYTSPSPRDS